MTFSDLPWAHLFRCRSQHDLQSYVMHGAHVRCFTFTVPCTHVVTRCTRSSTMQCIFTQPCYSTCGHAWDQALSSVPACEGRYSPKRQKAFIWSLQAKELCISGPSKGNSKAVCTLPTEIAYSGWAFRTLRKIFSYGIHLSTHKKRSTKAHPTLHLPTTRAQLTHPRRLSAQNLCEPQ